MNPTFTIHWLPNYTVVTSCKSTVIFYPEMLKAEKVPTRTLTSKSSNAMNVRKQRLTLWASLLRKRLLSLFFLITVFGQCHPGSAFGLGGEITFPPVPASTMNNHRVSYNTLLFVAPTTLWAFISTTFRCILSLSPTRFQFPSPQLRLLEPYPLLPSRTQISRHFYVFIVLTMNNGTPRLSFDRFALNALNEHLIDWM